MITFLMGLMIGQTIGILIELIELNRVKGKVDEARYNFSNGKCFENRAR